MAIAAGALLTGSVATAHAPVATYEVTITDLTRGQPLTPPVVATHRAATRVFKVGRPASFALKEIAENGNLAPMIDQLESDRRVADVAAGDEPLVAAGLPGSAMFDDSVTLTVSATKGARFLSVASMLICTNDGFTGVDRLRLPRKVGKTVVVRSAGYDAGTERNTEDFADIVPPCQALVGVTSGEPGTGTSNPALAEGGVIRHHRGIAGGADLVPAVHGWTDPVAEISVKRVS
ncbi:MAG: spondin domain-containing protein [Gaiellaceae bacterium]